METQYLLEGLRFYLLPSLLVALIPTATIVATIILVKSTSSLKLILLCLFAGIFMWCYLTYWSMQGFLIFPLGVDAPSSFTIPFAFIGGIVAGSAVYWGSNHYIRSRNWSGLLLILVGYLIFVFLTFSILNNRGVS